MNLDLEFGIPGIGNFGIAGIGGGGNSIGRRAKDMNRLDNEQWFRDKQKIDWHMQNVDNTRVQRRVKDAQAAGMHPLWALGGGAGGGGGGGEGAYVGSVAGYPAGNKSGIASFKKVSREESAFNQANIDLIKKRTELIQEQIDASRASRTDPNTSLDGLTEIVPDRKISPNPHDKSETAGRDHPAWKHFKIGSGEGESLLVPAQDLDSIWDSVAVWVPILSLKKNRTVLEKILARKSYDAWMHHPIMVAGKYLSKQTMKGIMERLGKGTVKTSPVPQRLDKLIDWKRL